VIESPKVVEEYLLRHRDVILYILYDERYPLKHVPERVSAYAISSDLAASLTTFTNGPGWFAVVRYPEWDLAALLSQVRYGFLLDRVSIPANLGAIVRSAAAFSVDAVFLTPGCTDPYHPESLRAMVGTVYDVPVIALSEAEIVRHFADYDVVVMDAHADVLFERKTVPERALFVLGSEGGGVQSGFISSLPGVKSYRIPINHRVESLNVAATSAILGYVLGSIVNA
jgi:tRNA G18 (ribose-2'-O)-methylase SpoU